MSHKATERHLPSAALRLLGRLLVWLYRARLGWILGERFLLLTHVGRRSGLPRRVVLEAIRHDPMNDTYFVASGFSDRSNWFRNIQKTPGVRVVVGRRRLRAVCQLLSLEEAGNELLDYSKRHPLAMRVMAWLLRQPAQSREECCRALAYRMPVVALRPLSTAEGGSDIQESRQ